MVEVVKGCKWELDRQGYSKTECGSYFHSGVPFCNHTLPDICPYCRKPVILSLATYQTVSARELIE